MADIEKEVKNFNGTVVGNPTLDLDTGIASGFGASNYLTKTDFSSTSPWELNLKIKFSDVSTPQNYFSLLDSGFSVGSGKWVFYLSSVNGTSDIANNIQVGSVSANVLYWVKFVYSGSDYKFYISTDGETFNLLQTFSTSLQMKNDGTLWFGNYNGTSTYPLGSGALIDLSETYININGQRWWDFSMSTTYYGSTFKVHQTLPYMFGARGVGYYDSVVSKVPTANEDILLTMKAYDGLTETYTEGIGTAGKVDFTGTILPWKWDYNSGLDTSKYCLMPSGLTYENIKTSDVLGRNFTVVGSPTINDSTGVVSGFSINNYLRITDRQSYGTGTITSLEAVFKIHTPTSNNWTTSGRIINGTSANDDFALDVTSSTSTFRFITTDYPDKLLTVAGTLSSDTDYWMKITYDGTTLIGYLSTDGISYTQQGSVTRSSSELYITNSPYTIGSRYDNIAVCVWNGSIDLSETYINVNGVRWWSPYEPVPYSLPGCTYNFADDGSAATLNAFAVQGDKNIVLTPDVEYYGNRYLGTVEIPQHDVYQYNNGTWQNAPYLIGGHTYYFKMIGGGGGSSTWDGGAGAYWEGYYTPAQTVAVVLSQGGGGSGAGAYSRNHNGVKGGTTSLVGEGVSIVCEGGQGAIGLREGDETGNSSTYTYTPTITITNGTYETIKASTHYRPRRISWDDDTVTGYGAGGQAASGTKAPGNDGLAGYLEYYQVGTITINPTPADALVEMSLDGIEYTTTSSLIAKVGEVVYYRVSKEGYISEDTSVLVEGNETINVELTEEPQP